MRIRLFGRKMSDVLKLVTYMDKEGIEYELLTDIEVGIAEANAAQADQAPLDQNTDADKPKMVPTVQPVSTVNNDPLWRVARHDNEVCDKRDCRDNAHYGAVPVGS